MNAYDSDRVMLVNADCLDALALLEDESVDAVVTDPPYGIGFMGKKWDTPGALVERPADRSQKWDNIGGNHNPSNSADAARTARVEGRKFQTWCDGWVREILRVLKPGGYLLSFGGTRTYHRMTCAIEDAGFEIRDCISWKYGSGFPKSLNVGKAFDKAAGAKREVLGSNPNFRDPEKNAEHHARWNAMSGSGDITAPATDLAAKWESWGTALKPAHEPIVVARKPLIGTVAKNVEEHGTGAINIDGCRVGGEERPVMIRTANISAATAMQNVSTGATASGEMTTEGRWPPNVLLGHSPDCYIAAEVCVEGCPVIVLDRQSGFSKSPKTTGRGAGGKHGSYSPIAGQGTVAAPGDEGTASRFFPQFRYDALDDAAFLYVAKAARKERELGCKDLPAKSGAEAVDREEGSAGMNNPRAGASRTAKEVRNHHPTVKPVALMRWLVRLVTPPGGVVLDPFLGSGTTGVATIHEGFDFIGIEREPEYIAIAKARIQHAEGTKIEVAA